ncbi:MAG: hypothetical protein R3C59_07235 [Planctomycetaceae bacterium]
MARILIVDDEAAVTAPIRRALQKLDGYTVDLPLLIGHFLSRANAELDMNVTFVSDAAMTLLTTYHWPGNIRELQSILKRAVLNASGPVLLPEFLPPPVRRTSVSDWESITSAVDVPVSEWDLFVDSQLTAATQSLYDDTLARMERWLLT